MLLNPKTPLVIGFLLICLLVGALAYYSPMPGELSVAHAGIAGVDRLDGCQSCHTSGGITPGCLSCHQEIALQLELGSGFHNDLVQKNGLDCAQCHAEHLGPGFSLVNEHSWGAQTQAAFRHSHVSFHLAGSHNDLACVDCHQAKRSFVPGISTQRPVTFLGLQQECRSCHEDKHTEGLTGECDTCHGQEQFNPPVSFDHDQWFPLDGGHAEVACGECHVLPDAGTPQRPFPFPFDKVRGLDCQGCHESPHISDFGESCDVCHQAQDTSWRDASKEMSAARHELTGFPLAAPHASVACMECHPPERSYRERHFEGGGVQPSLASAATEALSRRRPNDCEACHEDVHKEQFGEQEQGCLSCHDPLRFQPSEFGHRQHGEIFPLRGAHEAVPCLKCHVADEALHNARRFRGTGELCSDCHDDPHAGQFATVVAEQGCKACHSADASAFIIRPFAHEKRTGYALQGGHARAECNDCHRPHEFTVAGESVMAMRFSGTSQECGDCHKDIHRGQFAGESACDDCHRSHSSWDQLSFSHNRDSDFQLVGVHAGLSCTQCHRPTPLEDGSEVIQYKPLGTDCGDCHEVPR